MRQAGSSGATHTESPASTRHPSPPGARRRHPRPQGKPRRRLIQWEWGLVLVLLAGLGISLLAMSHGPDAKHQATQLVEQMKAAALGHPPASSLFGAAPMVQRGGRDITVTQAKVPPKVCVLASWDLTRLGLVTVNGVTPQRVSAEKLVDLCNQDATATLTWTTHPAKQP